MSLLIYFFGVLAVLGIAYGLFKFMQARQLLKFYEQQGFVPMRGSLSFPLGLVPSIFKYN